MADRPSVFALPTNTQLGVLSDGSCLVVGSLIYEPPIVVVGQTRLYEANEIGHLTYFSRLCSLLKASVGRYCSIAEGVFIGPWEHPINRVSTHPFVFNNYGAQDEVSGFEFEIYDYYTQIVDRKNVIAVDDMARTHIGHDVWIGRNATILQGINVGNGAIVGAHAVVTKDVEPYTIVAGVPARLIRRRFDADTVRRLEEIQWWNYDIRSVRRQLDYQNVGSFLTELSRAIANGSASPLTIPKLSVYARANQVEIVPHVENPPQQRAQPQPGSYRHGELFT